MKLKGVCISSFGKLGLFNVCIVQNPSACTYVQLMGYGIINWGKKQKKG